MNKEIGSLKKAILKLHHCDSEYIESIPIKETFRDETVWEGVVEVFKLIRHPKATKCYAWSFKKGKNSSETSYVTILELSPVDSPKKAVQVYILNKHRQKG